MRELLLPVIAILAMTCSAEMKCNPKDKATCKTSDKSLQNGFLSHECKSSLYYELIDGEYVERFCESNKIFDINLGKCTTMYNYSCPLNGTIRLPVKDDCSSYYLCQNGEGTMQECEFGLSFDKETGSCTWPPSVECNKKSKLTIKTLPTFNLMRKAGVECPAEGLTKIPHECSCTVYYQCKDGARYFRRCRNGLIYDYVRQVCDKPEVAVCKNSKHNSMYAGIEETVAVPERRQCKKRGKERLSHESNCRLYYQCDNGRSTVKSCLEGHYFNQFLETCDLKENTICTIVTPGTTTAREEDCPKHDCGIVRYPYPMNCSQFYECENGTKEVKDCPHDLYYDPDRQLCTWPDEVECQIPKNCTDGSKSPHECQCDQYYVCENGEHKVESCEEGKLFDYIKLECIDEDDAMCNGPHGTDCIGTCSSANSTEHLPHKECNMYCECKNGLPIEVVCPPKQFYDPDRQGCFWPEDIKDLQCTAFPCNSNTSGSNLPHECSCDLYYECRNGSKYRKECKNGTSFDYEKEKCVNCADAHCYTPESSGACQCKETCSARDSPLPIIHEDCDKYCVCKDGKREVEECPKHQYYNTETGKCDWPENIKVINCEVFPCTNNTIPHECICNEYYTCINGSKYRTFCDDEYEYDYELAKCVKTGAHCYHEGNPVSVKSCVGSCSTVDPAKTSFLPHRDCARFCICKEGAAYIVSCHKGLHFNKELNTCTSPKEANCQPLEYIEQNAAWKNFPFAGKYLQNIE